MFRFLRIAILLTILLVVAGRQFLTPDRLNSWDKPVWVTIFPVLLETDASTRRYATNLAPETFAGINQFLKQQAVRYGRQLEQPVVIQVAEPLTAVPPDLPTEKLGSQCCPVEPADALVGVAQRPSGQPGACRCQDVRAVPERVNPVNCWNARSGSGMPPMASSTLLRPGKRPHATVLLLPTNYCIYSAPLTGTTWQPVNPWRRMDWPIPGKSRFIRKNALKSWLGGLRLPNTAGAGPRH